MPPYDFTRPQWAHIPSNCLTPDEKAKKFSDNNEPIRIWVYRSHESIRTDNMTTTKHNIIYTCTYIYLHTYTYRSYVTYRTLAMAAIVDSQKLIAWNQNPTKFVKYVWLSCLMWPSRRGIVHFYAVTEIKGLSCPQWWMRECKNLLTSTRVLPGLSCGQPSVASHYNLGCKVWVRLTDFRELTGHEISGVDYILYLLPMWCMFPGGSTDITGSIHIWERSTHLRGHLETSIFCPFKLQQNMYGKITEAKIMQKSHQILFCLWWPSQKQMLHSLSHWPLGDLNTILNM